VEQTYLVAFKPPSQALQLVIATTVEVQGEHLVFLNGEGKLAALFLMEIVEVGMRFPASRVCSGESSAFCRVSFGALTYHFSKHALIACEVSYG
jgi:hypothetical protein